jgi:hypothetical protein
MIKNDKKAINKPSLNLEISTLMVQTIQKFLPAIVDHKMAFVLLLAGIVSNT